jgi:hypothetical protein
MERSLGTEKELEMTGKKGIAWEIGNSFRILLLSLGVSRDI